MIVFPWAEPELVAAPLAAAAELVALEPVAVVELDELQAAATPDRRVAAATAASNLFLVGISIETFRYVA